MEQVQRWMSGFCCTNICGIRLGSVRDRLGHLTETQAIFGTVPIVIKDEWFVCWSVFFYFSPHQGLLLRVDSFLFFFSFVKYETVRNRSLFRLVSIVSQTEKNTKIRKKVLRVVSRNCETMFCFVFT